LHAKDPPIFRKTVAHAQQSAAPFGLPNASQVHSKLRARSPLSGEFGVGNPPLMTTFERNRPPFIFVHSHAAVQKSSGAIFRGLDRERCRKRAARVRNALRAAAAVPERDVMVNLVCVAYFFRWLYLCEKVQGNDYAQSA